MHHTLAVDVGGTKIAAARVDADGRIVERGEVPTRGADGEDLFGHLLDLLDPLLSVGPVEVCGVGCGGPMADRGNSVSPLNIPQWRGFPLRSRLAGCLGVPVAVENDAKALALGEGWRGAAMGHRNFLAMVVSTGVGGGVVLDGRLLDGAAGNAGHIGHVVVDPAGPQCACGSRGCLEAMASGTALERELGESPEGASEEVRRRTGRLVGRAVASVVNLLDLPLAVVAGSVALGFGAPFFEAAQAELDLGCGLEFTRGARVVPGGLGADGPLVGAAAVGRSLLGYPCLGEGSPPDAGGTAR